MYTDEERHIEWQVKVFTFSVEYFGVGPKVLWINTKNRKCPKKVTEFQTEVTPETFGQENQFWYFWNAGACSHLATEQLFENKFVTQDGGQSKKGKELSEVFVRIVLSLLLLGLRSYLIILILSFAIGYSS